MRLKAIIADDEPLARERLRFLLSSEEEIEIVAECRNGREVVSTIRERLCDVVFLDIPMPTQSGFDVIEEIGFGNMPVIVFVTAHTHYALKAFEAEALDYLTKPIEPGRLRMALARVRERVVSKSSTLTKEQLRAVLSVLDVEEGKPRKYPHRLIVPNGAKNLFVLVGDIQWIEAADYYSCLHVGTKNLMLREPIKQLAELLDPAKFIRVHRSAIVNIDHVKEIIREGRSEDWILLSTGQRLKMSKSGWQAILAANRTVTF